MKPARLFINIGTNDLSDASIPIDSMIETYDKIITAVEQRLPMKRWHALLPSTTKGIST